MNRRRLTRAEIEKMVRPRVTTLREIAVGIRQGLNDAVRCIDTVCMNKGFIRNEGLNGFIQWSAGYACGNITTNTQLIDFDELLEDPSVRVSINRTGKFPIYVSYIPPNVGAIDEEAFRTWLVATIDWGVKLIEAEPRPAPTLHATSEE